MTKQGKMKMGLGIIAMVAVVAVVAVSTSSALFQGRLVLQKKVPLQRLAVEDTVYITMSPEVIQADGSKNVTFPDHVAVASYFTTAVGVLQVNNEYLDDDTKVSVTTEDTKLNYIGKELSVGQLVRVYPNASKAEEFYTFKVATIKSESGTKYVTFAVKHYVPASENYSSAEGSRVYLVMAPEVINADGSTNVTFPFNMAVSTSAGTLIGRLQVNGLYLNDDDKTSVTTEAVQGSETGKDLTAAQSIKVSGKNNEYYTFYVEDIRHEGLLPKLVTFSVKHYK